MKFKYKAHRPGEEDFVYGESESLDRFQLSRQIRDQGLLLISADAVDVKWFDFSRLNESVVSIKLHEKVIFANNLGAMISAGLSLTRALEVIGRQAKNLKLKRAIEQILKDINAGLSLSESLTKFPNIFSAVFIAMVYAGEQSGNLPETLNILGDQMEKTYIIQRKVKGAMAYPAVILFAMIIIGVLMLTFVVPNLIATFKEFNVELPLSTRIVITLSGILTDHWIPLIIGVLISMFGIYKIFHTVKGKRFFDYVILHIPLISGIIKQLNSATTARTLSSLIRSGVNIIESLEITSKVLQNSYYRDILIRARDGVEKGEPLSSFFQQEEKLFPVLIGELTEVGEETGKLADMLANTATFYENEVDSITKDMSTIVEPILMIFIGLVVGFFAISMIQPIYSITSAI